MSFDKELKKIALAIILALVVIFLALFLPFILSPKLALVEKLQLMQVTFSAVAFLIIFIALIITISQFRKSMAKPRIKVAFNEKGEQQATLTYKDGRHNALPGLWLINEGNAISRYFQIDFIIPENIGKPSAYVPLVKNDGTYILSYINDGKHTLFVNRPYSDPNMIFSSALDIKKCIEVYEDSFEIEYRIYGDWAETQEGKLKVNINKQ